jgi:hypothetical protein
MHKIYLILFLSSLPAICTASNAESPRYDFPSTEQSMVKQQQTGEELHSVTSLLAEMNKNNARTTQLLDKIVSEGCSRQLQVDTIKLVANMNRNIQIMTNIMVRMGYNIEELSRAPKKMNDLPFMP